MASAGTMKAVVLTGFLVGACLMISLFADIVCHIDFRLLSDLGLLGILGGLHMRLKLR